MNVPLPPSNHGSKNSLRKKSREVSTSSEAMNVPLPPSHLGSKDSFQNKSHENTSKHFIIQERHIPKSFNKPRTDLPRPPNYYNQPLRDSKPQVHVKDQTQGYSKKYNRTKSQDHLWHPDLPQKPVKNFSVNEKTFQKIPWKSETALLNESVNFSPSNEQGGKSKGI
ncbi:hypothetical protein HMI56_004580 [Coelomomyces lativittatus]|nr:hypothetical protein HMI56_004580 [Coelomomyces lativittatus]